MEPDSVVTLSSIVTGHVERWAFLLTSRRLPPILYGVGVGRTFLKQPPLPLSVPAIPPLVNTSFLFFLKFFKKLKVHGLGAVSSQHFDVGLFRTLERDLELNRHR